MHNQKQWHAIAIIDPIALAIAIHAQVIKCSSYAYEDEV